MAGAEGGVVQDPAGCILPAAAVAARGVLAHGDAAVAEVAVAAGGEEGAPGGGVAGASCPAAAACSTAETRNTCLYETEHNHARTQMTGSRHHISEAMK